MNVRSIRFRLITWYAGLLAVLFVFLGISGYLGLRYYLKQQIVKASLTKNAGLIAGTLIADIDQGETYLIDVIKKHYAPEINDRFFRITRGDGSILFVSGLPKDGSFDPTNLPLLKGPAAEGFLREESTPSGGLLIYALPLTLNNGQNFLIESGVSSNLVEAPLAGLLTALGLGLPILILVAVVGGYLLIRRALTPVDQITQSAERITSTNLGERLPTARTGDEMERLSISLNNMIERLEKAFHHISQFSADASHELRTPLTILHCDLEAIIQKPKIAKDVRETIGSALGETEHLAKIVDGLLAISRLDAGEARIELEKVDLAEITMATAEQMRLLAEDKCISLYCHAGAGVIVEGDSARLKQVIVNVLDNAIKYTSERGSIYVKVTANNGMGILEVEDTGIGISADALPHVFERFYRADKARSRGLGGTGLGLSIVKSICTAHGGQVFVESFEGQGSRFQIKIPLAEKIAEGTKPESTSDQLKKRMLLVKGG